MLQRRVRTNNTRHGAGSIWRQAGQLAAVSALAVGMAISAMPAQAVTKVGGQGWFAWSADYAVSLPFVSGATYAAGTNPWNPQALTDFSTYNTIRFMDWGCTNANENVAWTDRKIPTNTDQSAPWTQGEWQWAPPNNWTDTGTPPAKGQGMAYEWMVDLCNRTNTNLWICIPHKASDDYVTKLAQLIRFGSTGTTPYTSTQGNPTWKPLNSNLNVYIEYSNEVWNSSFDQNHWAGQQATAQGLPDEPHYYGRRVVQCDNLFYTVWSGSTSRLVRVLGQQDNDTYWATQTMNQVQADGGTVDAVAVAPYWDVGDGASSSYNSNATTAINSELAGIATMKTWANSYGLKLVCYEGGMGCSVNADQARRNSNNLSLYQTFLTGLNSNGVDEINLYAHVGAVGTSNSWGGKEFWAQATSAAPTWNGVVTWITNHPGSGNGGGGVTIPPAPTGLTAAAGNAQVSLSWGASSGATAYDVKRSTVSGSGYVTVSSPTTTSYTNTGLTNGTTYYFVVDAKNSAGASGNSSQASATPVAGSSGLIKINCAGPAVSPFVADVDFSGGLTATNWTGTIDTSAVTSPAPQAVYQSERYGAMTYTMGGLTSGTSYTVRLHFCENYFTTTAQRKFNVTINGTAVLTNFDIYATTGAIHKANCQQFTAVANGSGQVIVAFANVTNNALVNGIEVNAAGGGGGTTTLNPTADRDNQSDNAAGTNPTINISQWDNPYYKFDTSSVTGTITNAKLRFYRLDNALGSLTFNAHQAVDTWTENGTVPGLGTTIQSVVNNAVGYIEFDVTAYVNTQYPGDRTISFGLDNNSGNWTTCTARESATNKPQLVITHT